MKSIIERLVKLANTMDEKGFVTEAGMLDTFMATTLALGLGVQNLPTKPTAVERNGPQVTTVDEKPKPKPEAEAEATVVNDQEIYKYILHWEESGVPKTKAYLDSSPKKNPTIGVGFNINAGHIQANLKALGYDVEKVKKGTQQISLEHIQTIFDKILPQHKNIAKKFLPTIDSYPKEVQLIVYDLAWNLDNKLFDFVKFQKALTEKNYKTAAAELLDSDWSKQTGNRAKHHIDVLSKLK